MKTNKKILIDLTSPSLFICSGVVIEVVVKNKTLLINGLGIQLSRNIHYVLDLSYKTKATRSYGV